MRARPSFYCQSCGEQYEELHKAHTKDFVGDTFLGYKEHTCKSVLEKLKMGKESKEPTKTIEMKTFTADEISDMFERVEKIKKEFSDKQIELGFEIQRERPTLFNPPKIKTILSSDEYAEYRVEANNILLHTSLDLKHFADNILIKK